MKTEYQITEILPYRVKKDYSVGIYARVSTNRKQQLDSLANQISGLTRLTAAHITWYVADIFIDVGSAKTGSTRNEFDRLIRECEKDHIDIVLTKSVSRFGRDAKETLEAVHRIKNAGKRVIFEQERIDTESTDSELLISVIEACVQSENEWRSENIRIGLKQAAIYGTSGLYNRPCYAYYKDENGMLVINEEKARVVRQIYDWYLEGASILGIKKKLKERRIKSPGGKEEWSKHTIERILTNMKYTGDVAIADSGGSGNLYLKSEHHSEIISKEKYRAVQIEMAARSNVERTEDGVSRKKTKYSSKKQRNKQRAE